MKTSAFIAILGLAAPLAMADNLKYEVFNPGHNSIFAVTSVIVEGDKEVMLVDSQFQRNDAETLVQKIKATGKPLNTIYISHGDPDFYFGLEPVIQAFPNARVIATPETVQHIKSSVIAKNDYWGPIMKENAPRALVIPQAYAGKTLQVGSSHSELRNRDNDPHRTYLWVPSTKTILGGINLVSGEHVWIADSQSPESRQQWQRTLSGMQKLKPKQVIPAHFVGNIGNGVSSIGFTQKYLSDFERNAAASGNSTELMAKMKQAYPGLGGAESLDISAKVIKGEMKW